MITTNGSGNLIMNGSGKVTIKTSITIMGTGTKLPIEIVGDFKDIPQHLHQIYIESMMSSYGSVNTYDNTKDDKEPMTIEEKKREWRLNKIVDIICKAITK